MRSLLDLACLFAACAFAAVPSVAFADSEGKPQAPGERFLDHEPVSDADLDTQRGGFMIDGVSVSLGAQLNTYLNGQLVLATTVNWTGNSATTTTTASATLTPATQAMLQSAIVSGGTLTTAPAGAQVYVANAGQTALYQSVANGLQNVLVNSGASVNALQTVNATVGLSGYAGFNSANLASTLGQTIGNAVGMAAVH